MMRIQNERLDDTDQLPKIAPVQKWIYKGFNFTSVFI
jgi:hypothetical protein